MDLMRCCFFITAKSKKAKDKSLALRIILNGVGEELTILFLCLVSILSLQT